MAIFFVACCLPCSVLAKFVGEVVERLVTAGAIGGYVEPRRVRDVEAGLFDCEGRGDHGWGV